VLPLAKAWPEFAPHDAAEVELTLFAGSGTDASEREIFFDDGIGWGYRDRDAALILVRASWNGESVTLSAREQWSGRGRPPLALACRGLGGRRFEQEIVV